MANEQKETANNEEKEKTSEKVNAWANLLSSISKLIWAAIILIILGNVGRLFYKPDKEFNQTKSNQIGLPSREIPWSEVDKEIITALGVAKKEANNAASTEIDEFIAEMQEKVDTDFLEWYFGYWNQQKIGLKGIWYAAKHWWDDKEYPAAAEQITQDIQEEFAKRVLRPQIAQRQMANIATKVIEKYVTSLSVELQKIPKKFQIHEGKWEEYLADLSKITSVMEGNRQVNLPLKALTGATAASAVVAGKTLVKSLEPLIAKIGTKISAEVASKAAGSLAAKTGAKVASKLGGEFLGPIVGIGIIIWDVYDHENTKATEKPILRKNIVDYFEALKESLLFEPETGIMSIVVGVESDILIQIKRGK